MKNLERKSGLKIWAKAHYKGIALKRPAKAGDNSNIKLPFKLKYSL